jgi:hypothetical protein
LILAPRCIEGTNEWPNITEVAWASWCDLRASALEALRRFVPENFYLGRELSAEADIELVRPLLQSPVHTHMTPPDHVASKTIMALAMYRRSIGTPHAPGRMEAFRRVALLYAEAAGDGALAEAYRNSVASVMQ